jgi:hypothetical protein
MAAIATPTMQATIRKAFESDCPFDLMRSDEYRHKAIAMLTDESVHAASDQILQLGKEAEGDDEDEHNAIDNIIEGLEIVVDLFSNDEQAAIVAAEI